MDNYLDIEVTCAQSFNHVQLFVTPYTVTCQAPLSWNFLGKNTGMGYHSLPQDREYKERKKKNISCIFFLINLYLYELYFGSSLGISYLTTG